MEKFRPFNLKTAIFAPKTYSSLSQPLVEER
jgi:hypothetical protein